VNKVSIGKRKFLMLSVPLVGHFRVSILVDFPAIFAYTIKRHYI